MTGSNSIILPCRVSNKNININNWNINIYRLHDKILLTLNKLLFYKLPKTSELLLLIINNEFIIVIKLKKF